MLKNVITLILGGGQGTRLYPLTKFRAKPAVPLAGKYRLIDIPISNCINSGINRMYVLTQFLSSSLHRHIRQAYRFDPFNGGFVEILAAQQTMDEGTDWYQGTADAVRKNLRFLDESQAEYVLILSGDQLYRMNYRHLIATHEQCGADVTIAGLPVSRHEAGALGIMRLDEGGRVLGFVEKPKTDAEIDPVAMDPAWFQRHGIEAGERELLANMGVYLFNRELLVDILRNTDSADFGKQVFPQTVATQHVQMHMFDEYWEDIGTVRAFYEANLALAGETPPFRLESRTAPIYTRARFLPPARIQSATISNSLISDGCEIGEGSVIENSIIGIRCKVGRNVKIRNSVVFGDDDPPSTPSRPTRYSIGSDTVIEGAILDKNARVGRGVRIVNDQQVADGDESPDCMIRDGIAVVLKDAFLEDEWSLSGQRAG